MRVVMAQGGLGEVSAARVEDLDRMSNLVKLDKPLFDDGRDESDWRFRKDLIYLVSDWAVVRVIEIEDYGLVSNLQFKESRESAEAELVITRPRNETLILLDLGSARFETSYLTGHGGFNSLGNGGVAWMQPMVNRWAKEPNLHFDKGARGVSAFEAEKNLTYVCVGGIQAAFLLDTVSKARIYAFTLAIAPPKGLILDEVYGLRGRL